MKFINVPISEIEVGERRRQDFGDVDGLARGIKRVGLLQPIIVDRNGAGNFRLIAGERRLRAVQTLGWESISAQLLEHLTDEELRDVELEENENRKSLTEAERTRTFASAKKVVESAQKAREVLARSGPKASTGGRPAEPGSTRAVAQSLGTSRQAIERAEKQVVLAERFPFLQPWRQADVLKFEHHLRQLKPPEQIEFCDFLVRHYAPLPPRADQAIETAEAMIPKTAKARAAIYELSTSDDNRKRTLASPSARQRRPIPDGRIFFLGDALKELRKTLKPPYDTEPEAADLRAIRKRTIEVQTVIRNRYEQLKKEEEQGDAEQVASVF